VHQLIKIDAQSQANAELNDALPLMFFWR